MNQILCPPGRCLSFVGGGGKTTLLYHFGESAARRGQKALLLTTTHTQLPQNGSYAATCEQVLALWAAGRYAVIGTAEPMTGKLAAPETSLLADLEPMADLLLIEADGSKGHPCKVPRQWEPVLLPQCDTVVGVFGLTALGQPLAQVCHCPSQVQSFLGVGPDHRLTEGDAARILTSPAGTRKGVGRRAYHVVLNQGDTPQLLERGTRLARLLREAGIENVQITAFSQAERDRWRKSSYESLNCCAGGR